jgi:hypothetical protein
MDDGRYTDYLALITTDSGMSRTEEDIIDALVAKGVIALADLPEAVQTRYAAKKAARAAYNTVL